MRKNIKRVFVFVTHIVHLYRSYDSPKTHAHKRKKRLWSVLKGKIREIYQTLITLNYQWTMTIRLWSDGHTYTKYLSNIQSMKYYWYWPHHVNRALNIDPWNEVKVRGTVYYKHVELSWGSIIPWWGWGIVTSYIYKVIGQSLE